MVALLLTLALGRTRLVIFQGEILGMPYHIQYLDRWGHNYQAEIETLLTELVHALDPSLPGAEIAQFNAHGCTDFDFTSPFLYAVLAKSKAVYQQTQGAYDPTVLPLVQAWATYTTSEAIPMHRLRALVSLDYVVANAQRGKKLKEGVQLDFRGILKGHAIDVVADFLKGRGIAHFQVTLASETIAQGQPSKRQCWQQAIHPQVAALAAMAWEVKLDLANQAVAISDASQQAGAYSQRPIIDPTTGQPAQNNLLAAVVIAPDGSTADAYATAMMARGLDFAQTLLEQQTALAAFLIYRGEDGALAFYASPNLTMQQTAETITLQPALEPS
ncbi:MAG: FAD:protein FMN transferase [Bacteroidota bacterium]